MDQTFLTLLLVLLLFVLLASGIWVAFALLGVAMIGMALATQSPLGD